MKAVRGPAGIFRKSEVILLLSSLPTYPDSNKFSILPPESPPQGSIVAYSQMTEKSIIRRLAAESAERAQTLLAMDERFIDLFKPFQQRMYYHPEFNGSFSIKSVLPAMFPDDETLDYKGLDIQAGDMASMTYANLDRIDDESERQRIREALLEYCKIDTLVMVMIWQEFSKIAETS